MDKPDARPADRQDDGLRNAAAVWLRIGCLGFGGPAGQIALMHRMLVEERGWIDERGFLGGLNFCMLLPGPEAQQLAIYIGLQRHGIAGGLVAGWLFVLPGAAILFALSILYLLFSEIGIVAGALYGVQAAVVVIVLEALLRIARRALKTPAAYLVAALAFGLIFVFDAPFPLLIAGAALIGSASAIAKLDWFAGPAGRDGASPAGAAAPLSIRKGLMASAACLITWLLPVGVLVASLGPDHVFAVQALFFSHMAVVTFGGAYAVLTYVAQQAVEQFGWLSPAQMIDALGLAETTPGPLVLVLQFVGFLGAASGVAGLHPILAGLIGSLIVLWTTFLPCFAWIFAGAPFIETIQRTRALSAALAAITACVVGVVLNLSVWFAAHVFFTEVGRATWGLASMIAPSFNTVDLTAIVLAGAAALALLRLKAGLLATLGGAALAGAVLSLFA